MVTTRMNRIEEVDVENRMVWVQPGVINQDLSTHTSPLGLYFVPDPSRSRYARSGAMSPTIPAASTAWRKEPPLTMCWPWKL